MKKENGKLVVIVGSDGSGKSTIARLIKENLVKKGISVKLQHWRPYILPSPRVFSLKKTVNDPFQPHAKPTHHCLVSYFLSIYYFLDFVIGYFFVIHPSLKRRDIFIIERYAYDMIFDPVRHRLNVKYNWLAFIVKLLPEPDLVLCFYGDPTILYARKKEISIMEIERQQNLMLQYFTSKSYVKRICTTDADIHQTLINVLECL